jgi:release factor glutamine methyltransferase
MTMLLCPPGVYRAQTDTEVLIRALVRSGRAAGSHVLDVGTGSGAVALAAWRAGAASVTAVDLSRRSVLTARLNCLVNGARVAVHRGDLFGPVGERRFDVVVANPPYVPAPTALLPRHRVARCWDGGVDGRTVLDRICAAAAERLTPHGVLMLVHSGVCGAATTLTRLADAGLAGSVVDRVRIPFGPVMRARAALMERRGLIAPGDDQEELVVVEARRAA